jgi:superfamily II DNA helicase RecQ
MKRQAFEHDISCTNDPSSFSNQSLLIITPEGVVANEVKEMMIKLYSSNQLGRIFVDEAHLFSTDYDYRPSLRQLPLLAFLPVPITLLTATAPEWIVQDILTHFFGPLRKPLMIRQETNRSNIAYHIKDDGNLEIWKFGNYD